MVDIRVPIEAGSVAAAVEMAGKRAGGNEVLRVLLEPGFQEPQEPWPLDLAATTVGIGPKRIEVIGPEDRSASLRDVAMSSEGEGATVEVRGLVIRGVVRLEGLGCCLEDVEAKRGVEVGCRGAAAVRGCAIRGARVGVAVYGDVVVEACEVGPCAIGICMYGNPEAVLRKNRLQGCSAAAVVMHYSLGAATGNLLQFRVQLDASNVMEACHRNLEVHVDFEGVASLAFLDQWPLPVGTHTAERRRGGAVEAEVQDTGATLLVTGGSSPPSAPPSSKKRRRCRLGERGVSHGAGSKRKDAPACGPEWARELLGLRDGDLTARQLRAAYRRKAREVHPDKMPPEKELLPGAAPPFHEVTAAYEALLAAMPAEEARPEGERRGGG